MKVNVIKDDPAHFLEKLSCIGDMLTWRTNRPEEYLLIVRSGFCEDDDIKENLILGLGGISSLRTMEYYELPGDMSLLLHEVQEIAGYTCPVRPARYTVFICSLTGDGITLYTNGLSTDISTEIKIRRTVSRKRTARGGEQCLSVRFTLEGEMPVGYTDGALYYRFGSLGFKNLNYKFPITAAMLQAGFTVNSIDLEKPEICSNFMGFTGKITEGA